MTHVIARVRDLSPIQKLVMTYHWTLLLKEKIRLANILIISYSVCFSNATDTSIFLLSWALAVSERRKPRTRTERGQRFFYGNLIEASSEIHFIKFVEILTLFIPEREKNQI